MQPPPAPEMQESPVLLPGWQWPSGPSHRSQYHARSGTLPLPRRHSPLDTDRWTGSLTSAPRVWHRYTPGVCTSMLLLCEGSSRWPRYQSVLMGRSATTRGWYPSHRRVTRSPLKMVVQGGCTDSVGFSSAAAACGGDDVEKGIRVRGPEIALRGGSLRKLLLPGPSPQHPSPQGERPHGLDTESLH